MTACARHDSRHDGRNPRLYFVPASRGLSRVLCTGCLEGLRAMGMDWREERRTDPDRRWKSANDRFIPMWMRHQRANGRGKDFTGRLFR